MEMRKAFETLHNLFGQTDMEGGLPAQIRILGDTVHFGGRTAEREEFATYVREDGPAAWGTQVAVPAHSWVSRDGGRRWRRNEEKGYLWMEFVGSQLDVIYVSEDDALHWESYTAEDIDA